VVGFFQDKFANFSRDEKEQSSDAKSYRVIASETALTVTGQMHGLRLALAQWQRRVATVGKAVWWWYVRGGGDDEGSSRKVEPPPPPPFEETVDGRL
jgi:hypothetical protein